MFGVKLTAGHFERSDIPELCADAGIIEMKQKPTGLSQRYVTALRKHLKPESRGGLRAALELGRRAVALGLETLELARIHDQALATLGLANVKNAFTRQAGMFFAEANTLIEETHRAARQGKVDLSRLNVTLSRRTRELAASHRQVERGGVRRKVMVDAHEKSDRRHDKSLEESLELQKHLRQLTHKVLAAQEDERKKISRELQDEIAQTLLGINVRLLSLKRGDRSSTHGLKNAIASTQRLVAKSAQSVRRFARELNAHREAHDSSLVPVH